MPLQIPVEGYLALMAILRQLTDRTWEEIKDKTLEEFRVLGEMEKTRSDKLQERQEKI